MTKRFVYSGLVIGVAVFLLSSLLHRDTGLRANAVVSVDKDDIGGVVTSSKGPEAGVWVIAETTDLPTKYVKIVVTDDQGRYLIPELPKANYKVWVRGYGLVDSQACTERPGQDRRSQGSDRSRCQGSGTVLPVKLLVCAAADSAEERFPRHRGEREWHFAQRQRPSRMDR